MTPSAEVGLSKTLSYLLRHGATKEGLTLQSGGFIDVSAILQRQQFKNVTVAELRHIVDSNEKKRFALRNDPTTGNLQIRANQGHSLEVEGLKLTLITEVSNFPEVIHGTFLRYWSEIKKSGLSRMNRNHIHFATGKPGDSGVISGMRSSVQVYIYLDLQKAIYDGLQFYLSENKVILSPGNENGFIKPNYFFKVVRAETGEMLPFQK